MIEPKVDPKRNGQKEKNKFVAVKEHLKRTTLAVIMHTNKWTMNHE